MSGLRMLDTFCCGGGIGEGFMRAGWDVTGIDKAKRFRRYYPGRFYVADAVEYIANYGHEYDAIHASPPCQGYSRGNAGRDTDWPAALCSYAVSRSSSRMRHDTPSAIR